MAAAHGGLEGGAVVRADQRRQLAALGGVEAVKAVVAALAMAAVLTLAVEALVDEADDHVGDLCADHRRALFGQIAGFDLGVQLGAHFGDHGVDHRLRLDAVGLGDLGERLVVVQSGLQGGAVGCADQRRELGALGVERAEAVAAVVVVAAEAFVDAFADHHGQLRAEHCGALLGDCAGVDFGVQLGGHFRDHRVDHGLRLDAVGLGDLSERLVVVQRALQSLAVGGADQRRQLGAFRGVVVALAVAVVAAVAIAVAAAGLGGDDAHRGDGDGHGGDGGPEPAPFAGQSACQSVANAGHAPLLVC